MSRINYNSNPQELVKSDLKTYDTVSDSKLYLDELQDNHKLDEFVSRFIATHSQEVLDYFRSTMPRATALLVRDCLSEVIQDSKTSEKIVLSQLGLTVADVPRLELMLRNDFVLDGFSASFSDLTSYSRSKYDYQSEYIEDDGVYAGESYYDKEVLKFDLGTKWRYEHTVGKNKNWVGAVWLGLDVGDEIQHKTQTKVKKWDGEIYDQESYDDRQTPLFVKVAPGMSLSQLDDLFAVSFGGWEKYYFDPMPDATAQNYGFWLDASARKVFGLPLSIDIEGSYDHTVYSKPRDAEDNQQDTQTPMLTTTSTYQLNDQFGIVGNYEFVFTDSIYGTSTYQENKHNYDLLAQISFSDEHVLQLGVEGETLKNETAYDFDDDGDYESFNTVEQEVGGKVVYEGSYFDDTLTLKPEFKMGYNSSAGSLVGSYPDGNASLEANLNFDHWELALSGSVYHKAWKMEYQQIDGDTSIEEGEQSGTSTDGNVSASVTWKPSDIMSVTPSYSYNHEAESGFSFEDYPTHDASLSANLLALQVPIKLWVSASVSAKIYTQNYARGYTSTMAGDSYYGSLSLSTNRFQVGG